MKKALLFLTMLLLIAGCSSQPEMSDELPEDKLVEYGDDLAARIGSDADKVTSIIIQDMEGNEKQYTPDEIDLDTEYKVIYMITKGSKVNTIEETIKFQDTTPPTIRFLGENNTIVLSTPINYDTLWKEIDSYFEYSDNYKLESNGSPLRIGDFANIFPGRTIESEIFVWDNASHASNSLLITIVAPKE